MTPDLPQVAPRGSRDFIEFQIGSLMFHVVDVERRKPFVVRAGEVRLEIDQVVAALDAHDIAVAAVVAVVLAAESRPGVGACSLVRVVGA